MHAYFAETLAERREGTGDDLMSAIAKLDVDGKPLPVDNQIMICLSIVVAGNDTTRNTVSGAMITLAEHRAQWEKLAADPSLSKNATEELLRWISPVIHFGRRATEPVVIRDKEIKVGEFVVMLYGSANRDEDVWPDADVFDITRENAQRHLSFGWGLHLCIGAALGRAQVRLALKGLTQRYSGWEIAGEVTRHPTTLVNDFKNVPVLLKSK
jgi:cytochrome P450